MIRRPCSGDVAPRTLGEGGLVSAPMSLVDEPVGKPAEPSPDAPPDECSTAPRHVVVIGLAAALLGVALRVASWSPMWLDEALTVSIARLPLFGGAADGSATGATIFEALRHDGHPPLYYVLLHGWMEIFGSSNLAIRSLSGLFGLLCLPLAFVIGRRRGGTLLGWIAVAVVSLSPFAVRYSDEARMYSLVMALVFVGWLLVDDILRLRRATPLRLIALSVVTAMLLYTQYWGLWIAGAVGLLALWFAVRGADAALRTSARRLVLALGAALLLFLPWLPTMLYQSAHTGTPWASPMRPTAMAAWTLCTFALGDYADAALFASVLVVMILLALFGFGRSTRSIEIRFRPRSQFLTEGVVILAVIGLSTLVSFLAGAAYAPRYAAVYFPLVALLVAGGVTRFLGTRLRLVVLLVVLLPMLGGSVLSSRETRSQSRQIVDAIAAEAGPFRDILVVCPDQLGPAISRELESRPSGPLNLTPISYPDRGDLRFVDWVDYQQRNDAADPSAFASEVLALAAQAPGSNIFLVWNGAYRTFDGDCEAITSVLGSASEGIELVQSDSSAFERASLIKYRPRVLE